MPIVQETLDTKRLVLEPVGEEHAEELYELLRDPELHEFVPMEAPTLEEQQKRCARWARRESPDRKEIWLNWAGRHKTSGQVIAHFQAGLKAGGTASIGYVVGRTFQGQGIASEGLKKVIAYLRDDFQVREIKAWADTRNIASHQVAKKLGMVQVDLVKNADHFKGSASDEYVFAIVFEKDEG